jgi:hypothetical protein
MVPEWGILKGRFVNLTISRTAMRLFEALQSNTPDSFGQLESRA